MLELCHRSLNVQVARTMIQLLGTWSQSALADSDWSMR